MQYINQQQNALANQGGHSQLIYAPIAQHQQQHQIPQQLPYTSGFPIPSSCNVSRTLPPLKQIHSSLPTQQVLLQKCKLPQQATVKWP